MPTPLEQAKQLFKAGRYLDIVGQSDYSERELAGLQPEHRVLVAQAMILTGRVDRARLIVERERERATGVIKSKCELIIGLLYRMTAEPGKALQHYNLALQIALEQSDDVAAAWAALYRFRLLAQLRPSDELAPMLSEVRRLVAKIADPHAATVMHDAVASMEASNGRTDEARRHLDICSSLIRGFPNVDLEQMVLISSAAVNLFERKPHIAVDELNRARQLANVTGNRYAGVIENNLGHAMLLLGRLRHAENHFRHVLDHGSGQSRFSALEGLARVY